MVNIDKEFDKEGEIDYETGDNSKMTQVSDLDFGNPLYLHDSNINSNSIIIVMELYNVTSIRNKEQSRVY